MTGKRSIAVRLFIAALLAGTGLFLRIAARKVPGFADFFAEKVRPVFLGTIGRVFDFIPVSGAEFLLYGVLLFVCFRIGTLIFRAVRKKDGTAACALSLIVSLLLLFSAVFFLFEEGEDVCFYCTSFSSRYGLMSGAYETEELTAFCEELVSECNALSDRVKRDKDGIMTPDDHAAERAVSNMQNLGETYEILRGFYCRPKGVLLSFLMSYTNMAGIYTAYTCEANYNREMTPYNIPFTMSHELSHEKGVMQEQEAHLAAFLNCYLSHDTDFRYSGALSGWVYCGNELYKRDFEAWKKLNSRLDPKVLADLDANGRFWESHRSKVSEGAKSFNDSYLKSHGQKEGAASYDRVVDLMISWWKKSGKTL